MGAQARRVSLRYDDANMQISGVRSVASRRTLATDPAQYRMSALLQIPEQIIGPNHADLAVLQLAHAYEKATDWVNKNPPALLEQGRS